MPQHHPVVQNALKTLGLDPEYDYQASQSVVKKAYYKLVKENHPDKFATKPKAEQDAAEEKAKTIISANEILTDSAARSKAILNWERQNKTPNPGGFWDFFNRAKRNQAPPQPKPLKKYEFKVEFDGFNKKRTSKTFSWVDSSGVPEAIKHLFGVNDLKLDFEMFLHDNIQKISLLSCMLDGKATALPVDAQQVLVKKLCSLPNLTRVKHIEMITDDNQRKTLQKHLDLNNYNRTHFEQPETIVFEMVTGNVKKTKSITLNKSEDIAAKFKFLESAKYDNITIIKCSNANAKAALMVTIFKGMLKALRQNPSFINEWSLLAPGVLSKFKLGLEPRESIQFNSVLNEIYALGSKNRKKLPEIDVKLNINGSNKAQSVETPGAFAKFLTESRKYTSFLNMGGFIQVKLEKLENKAENKPLPKGFKAALKEFLLDPNNKCIHFKDNAKVFTAAERKQILATIHKTQKANILVVDFVTRSYVSNANGDGLVLKEKKHSFQAKDKKDLEKKLNVLKNGFEYFELTSIQRGYNISSSDCAELMYAKLQQNPSLKKVTTADQANIPAGSSEQCHKLKVKLNDTQFMASSENYMKASKTNALLSLTPSIAFAFLNISWLTFVGAALGTAFAIFGLFEAKSAFSANSAKHYDTIQKINHASQGEISALKSGIKAQTSWSGYLQSFANFRAHRHLQAFAAGKQLATQSYQQDVLHAIQLKL